MHDSKYENKVTLVDLYRLYSEDEFIVEIDHITFENLSFVRGGTLLSLQQQLTNRVTLSNSLIQDVEYAGVYIGAYDLSGSYTLESKVLIQNMSVHNAYMKDLSLILVEEAADLQIYNSTFDCVSNILAGSVIQVVDSSTVLVSLSQFTNNTSVKGGVFMSDSRSTTKIFDSTISNNFAVASGVISIENDASFQFYNSHIYHNFGYHAAITEIFSTTTPSIIDHCTIKDNIELTETEILEFIEQGYIHPNFTEYIKNHEELFGELSRAFAIEVILGSLIIQNGSVLTNQDNALYSIYSTLEINGLKILDTQLTFASILAQQGFLTINNVEVFNITAPSFSPYGMYIFSLTSIKFEMDAIEYHDSVGHLLHVFYSQGSISSLRAINVTGLFLIYSRSTDMPIFENSYFDSVSTSHSNPIRLYKSTIGSMRNITFNNFNNLALHIEDSEIGKMEEIIVSNNPAAIHIKSSSINLIDNLRVSK